MVELYNEDCFERLKQIESESIDLVVTDCPYHIVSGGCTTGAYESGKPYPRGIFKKYVDPRTHHISLGGVLDDRIQATRQGKLFKHNDIPFSAWLPDVYRVLKQNTHCYIFINSRNLKDLQVEAEKVGFRFQQLLIWDKGNATPNRYYLNAFEVVLMLRKGGRKALPIWERKIS